MTVTTCSTKSNWFCVLEKVLKISWSNTDVSIFSMYTRFKIKEKVLEEDISTALKRILHCYISPI